MTKETLDAFPSTKTSTLNFRQLPVANGTVFLKTSKTERQPREVYPNLRKFFHRRFLSIHFCSRDFQVEFLVEWFPLRKFNSFRNFQKLFRKISVPFAVVSKFSKVLAQWKTPFDSLYDKFYIRENE